MPDFEYKQRPWMRKLTDAEYDCAVGKTPTPPALGPEYRPATIADVAVVPTPDPHDVANWEHEGGAVTPERE